MWQLKKHWKNKKIQRNLPKEPISNLGHFMWISQSRNIINWVSSYSPTLNLRIKSMNNSLLWQTSLIKLRTRESRITRSTKANKYLRCKRSFKIFNLNRLNIQVNSSSQTLLLLFPRISMWILRIKLWIFQWMISF